MTTTILGISSGFHDASVSLINTDGEILFAGHAERYSKIKHDRYINDDLISDALKRIPIGSLLEVVYYENIYKKKARQLYSGQLTDFTSEPFSVYAHIKKYAPVFAQTIYDYCIQVSTVDHHQSHAAAGFQTSPYNRATVVVIDAIGEWDTISIWGAQYNNNQAVYKKLWSQKYPHSIGLLYSAFTKRLGLRPMDEEYILMGMAGWGEPKYTVDIHDRFVGYDYLTLQDNVHVGINDHYLSDAKDFDIACSIQAEAESMIGAVMRKAADFAWSDNLVYMGGVALNCSANRLLGAYFNNVWIMPNPGDAGSSLGAAAFRLKRRLNWTNAYLGRDIPGPYPVNDILNELDSNKIVGVASGCAEFGPRALGNRSLLADPRGPEIKDRVNEIKRRQKFRPFAPVILAEMADQYFDMPPGWDRSPYMQTVALCKYPNKYPAIVHCDGTSRVQTVEADGSGIRQLLEAWYARTGCPMLLNTSLNIRGEPMVNDRADADRFEQLYKVKVCS